MSQPATNQSTGPQAPLRHPETWTPAILKAFDECPRRYRFTYLDDAPRARQPSANLVFDGALHQGLARLHSRPADERNQQAAHSDLREAWDSIPDRRRSFSGEAEEIEWGEKGLRALSRYCQEWSRELEDRDPIALDQWVGVELPTGQRIAAKVDRLDQLEALLARPAGLQVIDWKSGRNHFDGPEDLRHDRYAQVQAVVSSYAFEEPVVAVRFHYLTDGTTLTWEVEADDLAAAEDDLAQSIDRILATEEFEPRPDYWCRFCPFRSRCPEGQGRTSIGVSTPDLSSGVPF